MSTKKPFIYLGIFAALALFYYFHEYKGGEAREAAEELANRAMVFSADSVESLRIASRPDGSKQYRTVVLEHGDRGWELSEPLRTAADSESVSRLLETASGASMNRVVEDSAADLAPFGLERPRLTLEVFPQDSDSSLTLRLGNKNPTNSYIYAVNGSRPRRVILLNSWLLSDLDKTADELRDRKALHFDRYDVRHVSVRENQVPLLEVDHDGERWVLGQPLRAPADPDSVDSLLENLEQAEAAGFLDTLTLADMAGLGLDPPRMVVEVIEQDREAVHRLQIGGRDAEGRYYARRSEMDNAFLLSAELVSSLTPPADRLRERSLVSAARTEIESLSVKGAHGEVAAVRDSSGVWKITAPERMKADQSAVDGLLWDLTDLRAAGFVGNGDSGARRALEHPVLEIGYATGDGGNSLSFAPAGDSLFYVSTSTMHDIALVDSGDISALKKGPAELRYSRIADFDTGEVDRVAMSFAGDSSVVLEKDGEQWRITAPGEGEAQAWKVQNMLWDLSEMRFESVAEDADTLSLGFGEPALRVLLEDEGSPVLQASFAREAEGDGRAYARTAGDERTFVVDLGAFDALPSGPGSFRPPEVAP